MTQKAQCHWTSNGAVGREEVKVAQTPMGHQRTLLVPWCKTPIVLLDLIGSYFPHKSIEQMRDELSVELSFGRSWTLNQTAGTGPSSSSSDTAHADTNTSVHHTIDNRVRGIKHGNLISCKTAKLMAVKHIPHTSGKSKISQAVLLVSLIGHKSTQDFTL
ncbi:hypothetical protein C8Q74DRAFT_1219061 [Fomes fomentarius]|nr:hypothetical protein C8Q74DRAFT_1219061 [Fomes fomentarius]